MEGKKFDFLDKGEAAHWDNLTKSGIKFVVTDEVLSHDRRRMVKLNGMHCYEYDGFIDSASKHYVKEHEMPYAGMKCGGSMPNVRSNQPSLGQRLAFQKDVCDAEMPDLRPGLHVSTGKTTGLDTMGKLDDLDARAKELETELSALAEKITAFFDEAHMTAQEANDTTGLWRRLSGYKRVKDNNLLENISRRFDEKLASLRVGLADNRVASMIEEMEAKYAEARKFSKNMLDEIRKLA